jgi:hypothetical protein
MGIDRHRLMEGLITLMSWKDHQLLARMKSEVLIIREVRCSPVRGSWRHVCRPPLTHEICWGVLQYLA